MTSTSPVKNGVLSREPAWALSVAHSVLMTILGVAVTHHVIGNVTASAAVQVWTPTVAGALPLIVGWMIRRLVSPAVAWAEREGVLSETDFQRFEYFLRSKFNVPVGQPLVVRTPAPQLAQVVHTVNTATGPTYSLDQPITLTQPKTYVDGVAFVQPGDWSMTPATDPE